MKNRRADAGFVMRNITVEETGTAADSSSPNADTAETPIHRAVMGACAGAVMEYYDFSIYATLAIYLSMNFFPPENPAVAALLAVSSMGVAFVFRPLGGIVFGALGDRLGRRRIFLATLFLMSFATIGVGLLPGYATLGLAAPIILVILRIGQGLAVGGEYAAASTYVVEHSPAHKRGFYSGWLASMASAAMVMALLAVSLTQATMDADSFERWGWRIPFLFATILLAISLVLRSKLRESPVFKNLAKKGKTAPAPLRQVFADWNAIKSILVVAAGVCSPQITAGVTGSMLALYFLQTKTSLDPAMANLLLAAGCLTAIPMTILSGSLSDRFGRRQILIAGMAIGVLTYIPLFHALLTNVDSKIATLLIIIALQVPTSLIVGAAFSTVPEIFPAAQRMTSVAFAFSIGGIVGGLAPAVSLALTDKGGVLLGASWPVIVLLIGMIVNLLWVPNRTGAAID